LDPLQWQGSIPVATVGAVTFADGMREKLGEIAARSEFYKSDPESLASAVEEVLKLDPRSVFWKRLHAKKAAGLAGKPDGAAPCAELTYGFCIDSANVECIFSPDGTAVQVVGVANWRAECPGASRVRVAPAGKRDRETDAAPAGKKKPNQQ
jgi:hypothetical protein